MTHITDWPGISYEELIWKRSESSAVPHSQRLKYVGPYKAAITAEIADIKQVPLSSELLALVDEASREMARFDSEIGSDIAPFTSILLRSESAASSQIENLSASAKAIALAESGDPSRRNANIIVANTKSMEAAIDLANHLDAQAILDMHAVLLSESHPEWTGHWRQEAVWVGGSNYGPHGASYIAPSFRRVPAAIEDLVRFMQRRDIPALVLAAIAHAQFETIHPFPDGNGRTGRSLVHSILRARELTRTVTVPVSAGLLVDTGEYFEALTSYRQGQVSLIVELIANASFLAVANGRALISDLKRVRSGWNKQIKVRADAAAWKVADLLIKQPIIDSKIAENELKISTRNINTAIEHLETVGILHKVSGDRRFRKWSANEVLAALDAFAERAGRRG